MHNPSEALHTHTNPPSLKRKAEVLQELLQTPVLVAAEVPKVGQHLVLEVLVARVAGAPALGGHEVPGPQEAQAVVRLVPQVGLLPGNVLLVQVRGRPLGQGAGCGRRGVLQGGGAGGLCRGSRRREAGLQLGDEDEHADRAVNVLVLVVIRFQLWGGGGGGGGAGSDVAVFWSGDRAGNKPEPAQKLFTSVKNLPLKSFVSVKNKSKPAPSYSHQSKTISNMSWKLFTAVKNKPKHAQKLFITVKNSNHPRKVVCISYKPKPAPKVIHCS